jgi:hypothetical protein
VWNPQVCEASGLSRTFASEVWGPSGARFQLSRHCLISAVTMSRSRDVARAREPERQVWIRSCAVNCCETLMLSAVGGLLDSFRPQHGRKLRETQLSRGNESEPLVLAFVLQQYPRPLDLSYMNRNRNWQIVLGRKIWTAQYLDDRIGVAR